MPLAAYVATLDADHDAAHHAFKHRQATRELLPILFPETIFGDDPSRTPALLRVTRD